MLTPSACRTSPKAGPVGLVDQRQLGQHDRVEEPHRPGQPLHRPGQLDLGSAHRAERVPGRQHVQVPGARPRPPSAAPAPAAASGRARPRETSSPAPRRRGGSPRRTARRPRASAPASTSVPSTDRRPCSSIWNARSLSGTLGEVCSTTSSVTSPWRHRGNPAPCPRRRPDPRPRAVHRLLHRGARPAARRARRDTVYLKCWDEEDHHSIRLRYDPRTGLDLFSFRVEHEDDLAELENAVTRYGCQVQRISRGEAVGPGRVDQVRHPVRADHGAGVRPAQDRRPAGQAEPGAGAAARPARHRAAAAGPHADQRRGGGRGRRLLPARSSASG